MRLTLSHEFIVIFSKIDLIFFTKESNLKSNCGFFGFILESSTDFFK